MYNSKLLLGQLVGTLLLCGTAYAESPMIVSPEGEYLGNLNTNRYDPNSVANPYGQYGNRFSPDSVNNPYGRYGSRYSPDSARNPYAVGPLPPSRR